jgi:hypothetical protein
MLREHPLGQDPASPGLAELIEALWNRAAIPK